MHLNPNCRSGREEGRKSTINLSRLSVDSIRNERHKFIKRPPYLMRADDLRGVEREREGGGEVKQTSGSKEKLRRAQELVRRR